LLAASVKRGLLRRQEVVSMLPVLALQVRVGATCVDLCSSPGMKTMQLLEAVAGSKAGAKKKGKAKSKGCSGLVVANDAHPPRASLLVGNMTENGISEQEASRLAVSNHRGEAFPLPARPFSDQRKKRRRGAGDEAQHIGFDRVLTDVPCSGDGTIRKDRNALLQWKPAVGNQLHATQLDIAWRGLQLLRVGGLMVYSTCSLNPIEDEAVVSALLARAECQAQGAVSLEPWPENVLQGFKRRPGVSTWRVADHTEVGEEEDDEEDEEVRLRFHESYKKAVSAGMPHAVESLWPPSAAVAASQHLERCSRILPHDQDTGGFFVALLRKDAPLKQASRLVRSGAKADTAALFKPVSAAEAEALPAVLGLTPRARRRVFRRLGDGGLSGELRLGPEPLLAFPRDALNLRSVGLPIPAASRS